MGSSSLSNFSSRVESSTETKEGGCDISVPEGSEDQTQQSPKISAMISALTSLWAGSWVKRPSKSSSRINYSTIPETVKNTIL